jgi:hypothetical protein
MKDMSIIPQIKKVDDKKIIDNEPKRHIVLPGKRKLVGVKDKTNISEDYDQFDDVPPFSLNVDPSIQLAKEGTPYIRRDHNQRKFVKRKIVNALLDDADV